MEFKILIYIVGAIIYFVYKQYQKLQKDAMRRKANLQGEMESPQQQFVIETPKSIQNVKTQRNELDAEKALARQQNKMRVSKAPKPFFETPEHVTSVFKEKTNINPGSTTATVLATPNENNLHEEIDIRKMILYSELLKRPAW